MNFKKILKKLFIIIFEPIIIRFGYYKNEQVSSTQNLLIDKNSLLDIFFANLIKMGFEPKHIIDVGANHGTWTRETLKFFPNSYYTLIEPQAWLKSSIKDILDTNNKVSFNECGAGANNGTFMFTIDDRDDSCNFRYSPENAIKNGYKQIEVPVLTLNQIVENNKDKPFPDLVKIDAEGLDLEVLEGANELIGKTEVFLIEATVFCKGFDNSVIKVINFMDQRGYTLFDITDLNRPFTPSVLWLVELAFVKKGGIIDTYKIITR